MVSDTVHTMYKSQLIPEKKSKARKVRGLLTAKSLRSGKEVLLAI